MRYLILFIFFSTSISLYAQEIAPFKELAFVSVYQNGKPCLEKSYREGFSANSLHNIYSVTKTITAVTVLDLIRQGKIKHINEPIKKYLPDLVRDTSLTIKHLLSMQSGYEWDIKNKLADLKKRLSSVETIFLQKPLYQYGSRFNYDDANFHLLSLLVRKVSGKELSEYIAIQYFKQLGGASFQWNKDPKGNAFGGLGLYLSAKTLQSFAQKLLTDNYYTQLLIQPTSKGGYPAYSGYSLGAWVSSYKSVPYFYGLGYEGNYWLLIPSKQISIVVLCDAGLKMQGINTPKAWIEGQILSKMIK